eukprot:6205639-Pleurochrysis_carterae.AAC.2
MEWYLTGRCLEQTNKGRSCLGKVAVTSCLLSPALLSGEDRGAKSPLERLAHQQGRSGAVQ